MKAREARAFLRAFAEQGLSVEETIDAIEASPEALAHPTIRNGYAGFLRRVGRIRDADDALAETLRRFPDNSYAGNVFLKEARKHQEPLAEAARWLALAERRDPGEPFFRGRAAVVLISHDRIDEAWTASVAAIDGAGSEPVKALLRSSLSSILFWYGHLDIGQQLLLRGRGGADMWEGLYELVKLRQTAAYDDHTRALFSFLTESPNPYRARTIPQFLDYLWVTEGASAPLLSKAADWEAEAADPDKVRCQRICLADTLGDRELAGRLLIERPSAAALFRAHLPVAHLLAAQPGLLADADEKALGEVRRLAELYDELDRSTDVFEEEMRSLRVAVVGNSPCEAGLGRGPAIDAHDRVVRFNRATVHAGFAQDYGTHAEALVMPARGDAVATPAPDTRWVVFSLPDVKGRNPDWTHALKVLDEGRRLAILRGDGYAELVRRLRAPPSNGLRVLHRLAELRGRLDRDSVFGFAFTDQIGANATSSHYFEAARPAMHHNWRKEKEIFAELF